MLKRPGPPRLPVAVAATLGIAATLSLAGIAVAAVQPVDEDAVDDGAGEETIIDDSGDPADDFTGDSDTGEGVTEETGGSTCAGEFDLIDTSEEIAEFAEYDSDEFYVLDDDLNCSDDQQGIVDNSANTNPVLTPAVLPLVAAGTASTPQPSGEMALRSTGGRAVRDAQVPWQVQIFQPWTAAQLSGWGMTTGGKSLWEFQHLCGAAFVAEGWALTAAHCLPASAATTGYRVRLGAETIHNGGGYTYRIDRVVPFSASAGPAANGVWRIHDIALIHFVDDQRMGWPPANQARPIPIDTAAVMPDESPVYATGWGRISNRSDAPTSTMMKVELKIVANDQCARGPWGSSFVHPQVMCAAYPGRQTCQGDSGGPLVNLVGPPRLVGIVSWNNADCIGDAGRQGIYTRVASYAGWINRTIGR